MSHDIVADALNQVMNAKKAGKNFVIVKRSSKLLLNLVSLMKKLKYIDEYNGMGKELEIKFSKIQECRAIKPRYDVSVNEIEKYIRRFLPARNVGFLIISTSCGLMTHQEAMDKNIGGCLIAYIF